MGIGELVQFVLRSGSIDTRGSGKSRMQQGTLIHKKIQTEQEKTKEEYKSEVAIKLNYPYKDIEFILNGRIDSLYKENNEIVIEEIKSTVEYKSSNFNFKEVHKAQLFFYGLFYLLENNLEKIHLRLHYYHIPTDESSFFDFIVTRKELEEYINQILEQWLKLGLLKSEWIELRNKSIHNLGFLYPEFRKGQRELSLAVFNTIKNKKNVLIEAPTGIGKTAGTLFPAIKSLFENSDSQIYYLTAKTTIQLEAEKTLNKMRDNGLLIKSTVITARDKICFLNKEKDKIRSCNPDDCPYAENFFEKINPVLDECLKSNNNYNRKFIEEVAREYQICPYQLSLELSNWSDVIICDYNYTFDPISQLQSFNTKRINLIDEAHNLPDRARNMYSAEIKKSDFLKLRDSLEIDVKKFKTKKFLAATNNVIEVLGTIRSLNEFEDRDNIELEEETLELLIQKLVYFQQVSFGYFQKVQNGKIETDPEILSNYNECSKQIFNFLVVAELFESNKDRYHFYLKILNKNDLLIKLACLDPSIFISDILKDKASVLFSATLTPFDYYQEILLDNPNTPKLSLPSPFDTDKRLLICDNSISTRYKDRDKSYTKIAEEINSVIQQKKGHYIVFFPSYAYLNKVYEEFLPLITDQDKVLVQQQEMSESEREEFINTFKEETEKSLIGFCVMGGIFSEGIDLPKDQLIGTIIIGLGLPGLDYERDLLKDYFQIKNSNGYAYAYAYPGMNRVLQSAGRVIRTEDDFGTIIFIDDRFSSPYYYNMLPSHLKPDFISDQNLLKQKVKSFWENKKLN